MHKSRLGVVVIDCETENLDREAEFWGIQRLVGRQGRTDGVRVQISAAGERRISWREKAYVWAFCSRTWLVCRAV